ncbi:MAG: helix-turn-helix transcriptional regulator [Bradyrhizobium sp.]|nr:helix-turn-helix transcriptional regulator [Bradyrhizobium sp.]
MGQQSNGIADLNCSNLDQDNASAGAEMARASTAQRRMTDDSGVTIVHQLNGPLTALLLYIGELKHHSHQFAQTPQERDYLQKVVECALEQTERVCDLVKQLGGANGRPAAPVAAGSDERPSRRAMRVVPSSESGQRRLTRREREVLNLISEGCSNKEGALRMQISPRTFESHRAEAMRKLGARNTADLVRAALLNPQG